MITSAPTKWFDFFWFLAASEKDDDSGFESGGTIHEEEHDKEHAQQLPKIARTFTTSRFVTSGEGENKGGSTEDDGRYSNSNRNKDHESSGGGFTSGINFAKSKQMTVFKIVYCITLPYYN